MFYSQCLISRKGPLKPIWIAAYCHKKLKRIQVAETNISSSVDEIMLNENTVTYRVLGYLLLGVVRIFSKKVEYLYHDCNVVLTKIKNSTSLKKLKESMCATYASITLPERFELDGFDLELREDMNDGNMASPQQITLEERLEDAENGHYSFNKYYCEVDVARFEIEDAFHTPIRDALSPYSRGNYMEVHPSDVLTISEAGMDKFQGNELSREELSDSGMEFGANEATERGIQYNEVNSRGKQIKLMEITPRDRGKSVILHEEDPLAASTSDGTQVPSHMEVHPLDILPISEAATVPFQADELPREVLPGFVLNYGADQPVDYGTQYNEIDRQAKRIKLMEITPPDPGKSGVVSEKDLLAADTDGETSPKCRPPSHVDAATPEFMVIRTPVKKEHPRFSRKRKLLFDESIVLSNKIMQQSLNDPSDLVVKRRKAPLTALDVWRAYKLPNLYQDFLEPLIPCTQLLKTLYCKRSVGTQPLEASEGPLNPGEDTDEIQRELTEVRANSLEVSECPAQSEEARYVAPPEPSEKRAYSLQEERYETHGEPSEARPYSLEAFECPIGPGESEHETRREFPEARAYSGEHMMDDSTCGPVETPTISKTCNVASGWEDDPSEIEAQDIGLNLMDEELHTLEEGQGANQDGWSVRTRKVASFLSRSFLKQKESGNEEVLNVTPVLNGRTRKESARLFYEILVLKSVGFVDVKQDAPYGDICLLRT